MTHALESYSALALITIASLAAVFDWRSRRIPNALLVVGLVAGFGIAGGLRGVDGLVVSAAGFGVGILLFLPGFLLGFTGAGDVKLLAVLGAFLGPLIVFQVFVVTVILGAGLVVLIGMVRFFQSGMSQGGSHIRRYRSMLDILRATRGFVYLPPAESSVLSRRLPLAPLMALAVLIVLLLVPFTGRGAL